MRVACFAALAAAFHLAFATQAIAGPVFYGGEATLDACGATGVVSGLNPKGDNYLSVRSSPSRKATELDRLGPGTYVILCDSRGGWHGVVYGLGDCGTSSPIARRQAYRGPCASGWVFGKYVTMGAG